MGSPPATIDSLDGAADRACLRAVFERVRPRLVILAPSRVHSRDLEDLAQDVFVHAVPPDDYDPSRPIRPWLFAFAFRCASDWRRLARHRVEVLGATVEALAGTPGGDEALERAEDVELVLRALEAVDVDRRAVFILFELDGCPMKEIAGSLGIPLFTAYSRLRVAREEFTVAVRRLQAQRGGQ